MMNENYLGAESTRRFAAHILKRTVTICLMLTAFSVLIIKSELLSGAIAKSMALCANSLIPSLFIFTVASQFAVETGVCAYIGDIFTPLTARLWGMSGASGTVFLLGVLSGYPIAAECASKMYKKGELSLDEAQRLSIFANNAGPAYVIAGVGLSLRGSLRQGALIWLSQLMSAIILGIMLRIKRSDGNAASVTREPSPISTTPISAALTRSIDTAARSMLKITGFVACFSALNALIESFMMKLNAHLPKLAELFLFGLTEVTCGAVRAAEINGAAGAALTAFLITFSGLSVAMQTVAAESSIVKLGRYLPFKIIQGAISSVICLLLCRIFAV